MRLVYDGTSRSPIKKKPLGEPCGFGRLANESAEEAALVAARLDDEDLVLDARLATRRLALLALLDLSSLRNCLADMAFRLNHREKLVPLPVKKDFEEVLEDLSEG